MMHYMNKRSVRSYSSPLREDQAEATMLRIVEAAIRVLQRHPADLSMPAVAREAGVSVPTVYRHFGDKATLIKAVSDRLDDETGLQPPGPMRTSADLAKHVRQYLPHFEGRRALMRPAFQSVEGEGVRREQIADRLDMVRNALDNRARLSSVADHEKLVSIVTVLCTSETLGLLQEYLGLSGAEASESVAWAIERLTGEEQE